MTDLYRLIGMTWIRAVTNVGDQRVSTSLLEEQMYLAQQGYFDLGKSGVNLS